MALNEILMQAVDLDASDIHLRAGYAPMARIHGQIRSIDRFEELTQEDLGAMANTLMSLQQKKVFKERNDVDFSYSLGGVARFRVNAFRERGSVGLVFRMIKGTIMTTEELGLPPIVERVSLEHRGIVLVTGATGSGKSTTLAAMIDHINRNRACHILTIEDPVEFIHRNQKAVVSQREVGTDTDDFEIALRAALRQDPDVILIGEMRDRETVEIGMKAAETGHLVLATLHTVDATETINRVISYFPSNQQQQVRIGFAAVLNSIISQRLLRKRTGGRVAALEIMLTTERIKDMIIDPHRTAKIKDAIEEGSSEYGMQSFDQAIYLLEKNGVIDREEALIAATNRDEYTIKMAGFSSTAESSLEGAEVALKRFQRQNDKEEEERKKLREQKDPFEQNPFKKF